MADIDRLGRALSCPATLTYPRYPISAYRLLAECWVTVLYRYLPDTSAIGLLQDSDETNQGVFLTADDCAVYQLSEAEANKPFNPLALEMLMANDIENAVRTIESSRYDLASQRQEQYPPRTLHDIVSGEIDAAVPMKSECEVWLDQEFERLSSWILELHVVERDEREKHWPPLNVKTQGDLMEFSKGNPTVGWLNPRTSPEELRGYALAALAEHVQRKLRERTDAPSVEERSEDFLSVWHEVSETGSFRLGVTHQQTMGMSDGKECTKMVYDFDPSAKQVHCFPVLSFPPVRDAMIEGQLEI